MGAMEWCPTGLAVVLPHLTIPRTGQTAHYRATARAGFSERVFQERPNWGTFLHVKLIFGNRLQQRVYVDGLARA